MRLRNFYISAATIGVLFGSPALAADVPLKAPPRAVAPYTWTGVYVGGHAGYGIGMKEWGAADFSYQADGFLGGGQIGVNQQVGNWVIGIEADASWANLKGSQPLSLGGPALGNLVTATATTSGDRIVTVSGRLGFAQDRWLVYAKLGAAWAHETHGLALSLTTFVPGGPSLVQNAGIDGSETRLGAVFGLGAEYALLGNWSARVEYNYLHFRTGSATLAGTMIAGGVTTPTTIQAPIAQSFHLMKVGVNYRFDTPGLQTVIAPSPPASGFNWTGGYVGVQAAYGLGRKDWIDFDPNGAFDTKGWLAGGTAGVNAHAGVFVAGVEGEWLWTGVEGSRAFSTPLIAAAFSSSIEWLAIASARAGFVAADRWLVYGKAGVAFAHEKHSFTLAQSAPGFGSASGTLNGSALHTGFVGGVGVEHAFSGNWSAKLEYNYIGFRQQPVILSGLLNFDIPGVGAGAMNQAQREEIRQNLHLVKVGINYHFGAGPDAVRARY